MKVPGMRIIIMAATTSLIVTAFAEKFQSNIFRTRELDLIIIGLNFSPTTIMKATASRAYCIVSRRGNTRIRIDRLHRFRRIDLYFRLFCRIKRWTTIITMSRVTGPATRRVSFGFFRPAIVPMVRFIFTSIFVLRFTRYGFFFFFICVKDVRIV